MVYHSLIKQGQEQQLERLQRHALRVCFGYAAHFEEVMTEKGIHTVKERRVVRCDKFLTKVATNARFGPRWLREREDVDWDLRNKRTVQEVDARTNRRFNSTRAFLRRRANELGITYTRGA